MGIPFETLLPYAVCLGVCLIRSFQALLLTLFSTDVRSCRRWLVKTEAHAKWWQEGEAFDRHMGQAEYVVTSHGETRDQRPALTFVAVMERDYRLTGYLRGQSDRVKAPKGYELGSRWKVRSLGHLCIWTSSNRTPRSNRKPSSGIPLIEAFHEQHITHLNLPRVSQSLPFH